MLIKTATIRIHGHELEFTVSGPEGMTKRQAYDKFTNKYMKHSPILPGFGRVDITFSTREV